MQPIIYPDPRNSNDLCLSIIMEPSQFTATAHSLLSGWSYELGTTKFFFG